MKDNGETETTGCDEKGSKELDTIKMRTGKKKTPKSSDREKGREG